MTEIERGVAVETERTTRALPTSTKRAIRRDQLKEIVPLSDTTIYEMEQRGEFPQRFYLTDRCAAWNLGEVSKWLEDRIRRTTGKPPQIAPARDARTKKQRRAER